MFDEVCNDMEEVELKESPFLTARGLANAWRLLPFFLVLVSVPLLLLAQSFALQIIQGEGLLSASEENRFCSQVIWAERGIIYDSRGKVLVRNKPGYRVAVNLLKMPPTFQTHAQEVAEVLGIDYSEVLEKAEKALQENYRQVTIARGVAQEKALTIETAVNRWPEFLVEIEPVRDYPFGAILSHVIGYVSEASSKDRDQFPTEPYEGEKLGQSGLELAYDQYLRGKSGARIIEVTASGNEENLVAERKPMAGKNLLTSIDLGLQEVASASLEKALKKYQGEGAALVAQRPENGEVVALVSLPAYDPNFFSQSLPDNEEKLRQLFQDSSSPLTNRAISGLYPPGSTFKLVTASAALEEKVITLDLRVNDTGFIAVGEFTFSDWKVGGHGPIGLTEAIAKSCDTFFYVVGGGYQSQPGVGVDRLAAWARRSGFGQLTKIDLGTEAEGLVPDSSWKEQVKGEPWYVGNTYHLSIGQGDLLVTPLQLNNYTNFLANGNNLWRPFIVEQVTGADGYGVWKNSPRSLRENFISPETIRAVREGMHQATLGGGTAYFAFQNAGYSSAGKTGTAEYGDTQLKKTHAWYTAFAPYENPQISLTVLIEGGGEGSVAAALTAREIFDWYFKDGR